MPDSWPQSDNFFDDTVSVLVAKAVREGCLIEDFGANMAQLVNDPDEALLIIRGAVELFATECIDGTPTGRRRRIGRVDAGGLIPGIPVTRSSYFQVGVMAAGLAGSEVCRLPAHILQSLARDAESCRRLVAALDEWFKMLCLAVRPGKPTLTPITIGEQGATLISSGQLATVRETLCWINIRSGRTTYMDWSRPVMVNNSWYPMTRLMWLNVLNDAAIEKRSTTDLVNDLLAGGFADFHIFYLKRLAEVIVREQVQAERKLRARQEAEAEQLDTALRALQIDEGRTDINGIEHLAGAAPVERVFRRVAQAAGFQVRNVSGKSRHTPLETWARTNRLFVKAG